MSHHSAWVIEVSVSQVFTESVLGSEMFYKYYQPLMPINTKELVLKGL